MPFRGAPSSTYLTLFNRPDRYSITKRTFMRV